MDVYFEWLQQKKAEKISDNTKKALTKEELFDGINGKSKKQATTDEKKLDPIEEELKKRKLLKLEA